MQSQSGGFLDPIVGTLIVDGDRHRRSRRPLGVAIAAWLSEYRRPAWLARAVESAIEIIAGAPSVVLALFGLLIFSQGFLGFLSQHAATGSVSGRVVLRGRASSCRGLALPLVVGSTREALAQLPDRLREASYALGKTRATTIRRVLLPAIRPGIATGVVLGMGRIIGDTAIITILLGGSRCKIEAGRPRARSSACCAAPARRSRATSTTTRPRAKATRHEKAYAAAFVLLADRARAQRARDAADATGGGRRATGRRLAAPPRCPRGRRWTR